MPAIHRRFDYAVPPALAAETRVGSRVRIDLHGRRVGAWVVEDDVEPTDGVTAKPLAGSSGLGPPPSVVALAEWAAWRWAGPLSSFLGTASPATVVRAPAVGWPPTRPGAAAGGEGAPDLPRPVSPGGGSVGLVDAVLAAEGCAVVRLAPALDATLVALELIHRLGAEQTVVLAPSHARAGQVASRLRGAGIPVAMLPDGWDRAATERGVVVGTRSAAWAPLGRLRAAIMLDAHDEAYREERAPTWSAVDVIRERGRRDRAVVALVTPCPPVAMSEGVAVVTTPRPVEWRGWALVEVVDRAADDPRTGLFSERLVRALRSALDEGGAPVVCILNRTGRIRLLACSQCGALTRCTRCGGPMAQPGVGSGLQCRRCDHARPAVCAACDSTRLKSLRIGVSRATEELSALTGVEAVEITGRSAADHGAGERLVVGTEAALHRVARAGMVAFLDIDQHLLAPRFTAGEETLSLLARAARLVGTRDAGGRVLVQTRIPDHEVLRAAAQADPTVLAQPERALRVTLGLPPFGALAALRGPGAADYAGGLGEVAGVAVSSVDADRWLVMAADHQILCDGLASVPRPAGRLRVEVDPTDA